MNIFTKLTIVIILAIIVFLTISNGLLDFLNPENPNKLNIRDMTLLHQTTIEETAAFLIHSRTTFGDGLQCAGGLIHADSVLPIKKVLESRNIPINDKALIWLMNSKASNLSAQGELLFVTDQQTAESGIWIGWIDENRISKIKRMDGVNQ